MILLCSFNIDYNIFLTALSTISNMAMAFIALISYLKSIKRGIIDFDLVCKKGRVDGKDYKFWCLRIRNIGERALQNVSIAFEPDFIKSLPIKEDINRLENITSHTFNIRANSELLYILCPLSNNIPLSNISSPESITYWLEEYRTKPINIFYSINNECSKKCKSLILQNFDTQNIIFQE